MMRLSGSVKFFCALGSGLSDGGAAGRPGFLRPSACRRSSAFSCALAYKSGEELPNWVANKKKRAEKIS
jgi:hypothetical protein